jgi:hypothetical protein
MTQINMQSKGRSVKFNTKRKPLDGISFSTSYQKKDTLYKDLKKAHERAKYYTDKMLEAEHDINTSISNTMKNVNSRRNYSRYKEAYDKTQKEIAVLIIQINEVDE